MATDVKPPCGCGHPFSEHMQIKNEYGQPCLHIERRNAATGTLASVCGCSNYKPAMTTEQRFKNCVMEALVADAPGVWLTDGTAIRIVDAAWEKFSR